MSDCGHLSGACELRRDITETGLVSSPGEAGSSTDGVSCPDEHRGGGSDSKRSPAAAPFRPGSRGAFPSAGRLGFALAKRDGRSWRVLLSVGEDDTRELTIDEARGALQDLFMLLAIHDDPYLFGKAENGR